MKNQGIIVALDYPSKSLAMEFVSKVDPDLCKLKVGKQLFTESGPDVVETLAKKGFDVFLDLKFHDIPNTVHQACKAAVNMGIWMLNVHAIGGKEMLCAARDAVPAGDPSKYLVAVTVLTSTSNQDLESLGITMTIEQMVMKLAKLSADSGLDGVVCSAHETESLRQVFGKDFCLVTPGIRPVDSSADDQKRIRTPAQAISSGSDYLVIGRPVTQSKDPVTTLKSIRDEIESVLH
ncbi:MAG: orotidine-5'-phosphate decarboxylase [Gammaproteobacteria bacterium]|nr:orotidine-5'-phosphate decarboxylase [Gammaproteobacteria bacterium]